MCVCSFFFLSTTTEPADIQHNHRACRCRFFINPTAAVVERYEYECSVVTKPRHIETTYSYVIPGS